MCIRDRLTAAQEISYQMLQQMSTDIFNFFHFLRFSISRPSQFLWFSWFNRLKSDMTERINMGFFWYSAILLSPHMVSNSFWGLSPCIRSLHTSVHSLILEILDVYKRQGIPIPGMCCPSVSPQFWWYMVQEFQPVVHRLRLSASP